MMTKNMLDLLYDMFQEQLDYRLDDQEIKRCKEKLMKMADDPQAEYAILDYGIAYERAGFRNGFVIAARILSECINTGRIAESISGNLFES